MCGETKTLNAGGPSHPFRVFPHHHLLALVSLSLTVPPLTPTLAIGEIRDRPLVHREVEVKIRKTRFQEDAFAKKKLIGSIKL